MTNAIGLSSGQILQIPKIFTRLDKTSWAVLSALGLLAALSCYLISRAYSKKGKGDLSPTEKKATKIVVKPETLQSILKSIQWDACKKANRQFLASNERFWDQQIGEAAYNGDSFYDALAQVMRNQGVDASIQSLRQGIVTDLKDPEIERVVKSYLGPNKETPDTAVTKLFENYKKYVGYSHDELQQLRKEDPEAPQDAIEGNLYINSELFCKRYKINLIVIYSRVPQTVLNEDATLASLMSQMEKADSVSRSLGSLYTKRIEQLIETEVYTYPRDIRYADRYTLALCQDHFVPVFEDQAEKKTTEVVVKKPFERLELTLNTLQRDACKEKICLPSTQRLGEAASNGDSFYDALAQVLQEKKLAVSIQSLRQAVAAALENPVTAKWVKDHFSFHISTQAAATEHFEKFKKYVRYPYDELQQLRETDPGAPEDSLKGNLFINTGILCEKYQFNLEVIYLSVEHSALIGDETLINLKKQMEEDNSNKELLELSYKNRIEKLIKSVTLSYPSENHRPDSIYSNSMSYPLSYPFKNFHSEYTLTVTLVCCQDHFIPVLLRR